ncbi:M16 family metallopeptidase [Salegentibacter sp. UBA1130]|uniref:M16 family metallopeptidase n=1 Tax=Salegentibacter sp. UBA1130 TaxID=1947451 RepID=UPI00257E60A3|nr:insulinase family protein [Salegentibacter sp. UBA1130]
MKNLFSYSYLFLLVLGMFSIETYAQPGRNLKQDSTLIKNTLPSGFTYYIKDVPEAGDKIFMRFFVNAGNRVETPGQREVSHAIEHLAFRETKNFPLDFHNYTELFRKVGMKGLARDIYAFTGTTGTEYTYNANSNYPESVDLGILWFEDILNGLALTTEDINIERRTLIQEREGKSGMKRRIERTTQSRLFEKLFPCEISQEMYREKVNSFDADSLRAYYRDWYQPQHAGLVFVGNIDDVESLERKIKERFSGIKSEKTSLKKPNCNSQYFELPRQFEIIERTADPTGHYVNNETDIHLFYRDPLVWSNENFRGTKQQMLWELTIKVLRNNLQELTQSYTNNFDVEVVNTLKYKNLPAVTSVKIISEEKNIGYATAEVMSRINEIKTYGISMQEWENLKESQIDYLEFVGRKLDENPQFWINEIKENFWNDQSLSPEKYELLKSWMKQLTLKDYNKILKKILGEMPQDIGVIIPRDGKFSYSESAFRSLIKENLDKEVEKSIVKTPGQLLSNEALKNLKIPNTSLEGTKIKGGAKYILNNGVRIYLIDDGGSGEKINLWGFSPKGASVLPDSKLFTASKAPEMIKHSGIGKFNKFEVDRFLDSVRDLIQVRPYINFNESGIKGKADYQNSEILLQMVYLYFSDPRKDKEAFEHWKRKELQNYLYPPYSLPQADFNNFTDLFFGGSEADFLSGTSHFEGTRKTNLDEAFESYQTLFNDITDFTFIISGKFDEESLLPEIQKYLGNLKPLKTNALDLVQRSNKNQFPEGPIFEKINRSDDYEMKNVIYSIKYVQKPAEYDWKKHLQVQLISELLWEMAIQLRTDQDFALYEIFNGGDYNHDLSLFKVSLKLSCLPEELEEIKIAAREIFENMKEGDIEQYLFDKVIDRLTGYYVGDGRYHNPEEELHDHLRFGNSLIDLKEKENFLMNYSKEDLVEFANSFLVRENQYEFEM